MWAVSEPNYTKYHLFWGILSKVQTAALPPPNCVNNLNCLTLQTGYNYYLLLHISDNKTKDATQVNLSTVSRAKLWENLYKQWYLQVNQKHWGNPEWYVQYIYQKTSVMTRT